MIVIDRERDLIIRFDSKLKVFSYFYFRDGEDVRTVECSEIKLKEKRKKYFLKFILHFHQSCFINIHLFVWGKNGE